MSRSLGSIRVDLIAGTAGFDTGIDKAKGKLGAFAAAGTSASTRIGGAIALIGRSITSLPSLLAGGAAVFGVVRLVHSLNDAAEAVDHLGKKAAVLGTPIEELSALRFAAGEAGVDFDTLANLAGKAQKNIASFVRTGGGSAAEAIQTLGIEVTDTNGRLLSMTELLPRIASALQSVQSQGDKLDFATQIFGRAGGDQFIQLLEDGGDFFKNMVVEAERAKRLGVIFTPDQFAKLKEYNDAVGRIGEAWLGVRVKVMTEVAPFLTDLADQFSSFFAALPEIIGNGGKVLKQVFAGTLSPENQKHFAAIWDHLNRAAVIGVKGVFKALGGAVIDGANVLGAFAIPILKATMTSIFVVPLGDAIADGEKKVGELLGKMGTYLASQLSAERKKLLDNIAAGQARLKRDLSVLDDTSDFLHNPDRYNGASDELKKAALNDLAIVSQTIPKWKAFVADWQAELEKLDKGEGIKGAVAAFVPTLQDASASMLELSENTKLGNEELAKFTNKATGEEFATAIDDTFKNGSEAANSMGQSLRDLRPEFAAMLHHAGALLGVSAAMDKTATSAKAMATVVAAAIKPPPPPVRSEWDKFFEGLKQGFDQANIEAADTKKLGREVFDVVAGGLSDGMATALSKAEGGFRNFGKTALGVLRDVAQAAIQTILKVQMMRAILGVAGLFGPAATPAAAGVDNSNAGIPIGMGDVGGTGDFMIEPHARGAVFGSRGIVNSATRFSAADGSQHVMGENGTEGVLPLEEVNGGLGVRASGLGGGGVVVQLIDQRKSGERPEVQQSRGANGETLLRILVRDEVGKMGGDGSLDKVMGANYGIRRRGTNR